MFGLHFMPLKKRSPRIFAHVHGLNRTKSSSAERRINSAFPIKFSVGTNPCNQQISTEVKGTDWNSTLGVARHRAFVDNVRIWRWFWRSTMSSKWVGVHSDCYGEFICLMVILELWLQREAQEAPTSARFLCFVWPQSFGVIRWSKHAPEQWRRNTCSSKF